MKVSNQEEKPQEWRCAKCKREMASSEYHWISYDQKDKRQLRTCFQCREKEVQEQKRK